MAVSGAPHRLTHRALLYGSERQLLDAALPFLREGTAGSGYAVAITENAPLLRRGLGLDASPVEFIDARSWFGAPARTLTALLVRAHDAWWPRGPLHLLAEPLWRGRSPLEVREWERVESILNVAFAGTATRFLCLYNVRVLPHAIVGNARRTHPELVEGVRSRPSAAYLTAADFYAECNRPALPPPGGPVVRVGFGGDEHALSGLRAIVADVGARLGLGHDRRAALAMAAGEVAGEIIRQGSGAGTVAVWAEGPEVLCDLVDAGASLDDRFLSYLPPTPSRPSGAGMWAVRQLCDIVEIRSGAFGTLVRLHVRGAGPASS